MGLCLLSGFDFSCVVLIDSAAICGRDVTSENMRRIGVIGIASAIAMGHALARKMPVSFSVLRLDLQVGVLLPFPRLSVGSGRRNILHGLVGVEWSHILGRIFRHRIVPFGV